MPELPEVETVVGDLIREGLVGRRVCTGRVAWPRTVAPSTPRRFLGRLRGRTFTNVSRRGKYIVLHLDDGRFVIAHLRMSGRLALRRAGRREPYVRLALRLDDGRDLVFSDTRKFGRWEHVTDLAERFARLGPEPLDPGFRGRVFAERLRCRKRQLKPLLLDQSFVAGLGNIYVDESLWDARLHPCRLSHTLSDDDVRHLYRSIRRVLRRGIRGMGTSLGTGETNFYSVAGRRGRNQDRLQVFRRHGRPCPRCRTPIVRCIVGQRGTHLCPACQGHGASF